MKSSHKAIKFLPGGWRSADRIAAGTHSKLKVVGRHGVTTKGCAQIVRMQHVDRAVATRCHMAELKSLLTKGAIANVVLEALLFAPVLHGESSGVEGLVQIIARRVQELRELEIRSGTTHIPENETSFKVECMAEMSRVE